MDIISSIKIITMYSEPNWYPLKCISSRRFCKQCGFIRTSKDAITSCHTVMLVALKTVHLTVRKRSRRLPTGHRRKIWLAVLSARKIVFHLQQDLW